MIEHSFDILVDDETEDLAILFQKSFPYMGGHSMRGGYLFYPHQDYKSAGSINDFISKCIDDHDREFYSLKEKYDKVTLRIATYFDVDKVAAVGVHFSRDVIAKLHNLDVEVDITNYPCSNEEGS